MDWGIIAGCAFGFLVLVVVVLANPGKQHIPEDHRATGWNEDVH